MHSLDCCLCLAWKFCPFMNILFRLESFRAVSMSSYWGSLTQVRSLFKVGSFTTCSAWRHLLRQQDRIWIACRGPCVRPRSPNCRFRSLSSLCQLCCQAFCAGSFSDRLSVGPHRRLLCAARPNLLSRRGARSDTVRRALSLVRFRTIRTKQYIILVGLFVSLSHFPLSAFV